MRIMSFPLLIKKEETTPHCLKNCPIVIDGNNFFYNSYEDNKIPYAFGSEANKHARCLREILNHFKMANVKCYFVFKGGSVNLKKKLQKPKPLEFDFNENYNFVAPIFLKDVCKQVLEEGNVNYATSIMESKDDCVALAQKLGCSVLSNDIEYCFKEAPYIPYTTLKYGRDTIFCSQYNIKNFLHKYSVTNKQLAIFAVLSDTTVFPENHFNELLQSWSVLDENLYLRHKKVLKYLSEHPEEKIVNNVVQFLSSECDSKKFLDEIEKILAGMCNDQKVVVPVYLYNERRLLISQCDPLWFEKGVAAQNIPVPYIDLCKHKLVQGSWALEKKGVTESLMLSIDIIKYAYNLLTNYQSSDFSVYQCVHKELERNYIKINASDSDITKPAYNATESVFENGWEGIKSLKLFEHFLIENDINTDMIKKLPAEARMLIIALTYFARKKLSEGIDVTAKVYSFIVCHVILRVVSDRKTSIRKKSSGISVEDSFEALRATKKYFNCQINEAIQIYDEDELKTMVELQLCLAHMNYLNILCGAPYQPTVYHRSFNGTFIYKLFHDMRVRNENQFIESLFRSAPTVYRFINMLITIYKKLI